MLMHVILHLYIYTEEDCHDLQMDLDSLTQYMWQIIIHLIYIEEVIDQNLAWSKLQL